VILTPKLAAVLHFSVNFWSAFAPKVISKAEGYAQYRTRTYQLSGKALRPLRSHAWSGARAALRTVAGKNLHGNSGRGDRSNWIEANMNWQEMTPWMSWSLLGAILQRGSGAFAVNFGGRDRKGLAEWPATGIICVTGQRLTASALLFDCWPTMVPNAGTAPRSWISQRSRAVYLRWKVGHRGHVPLPELRGTVKCPYVHSIPLYYDCFSF